MSKRQMIILLGVWVAAFLFLGFPSSWDKVLAVASGLLIIMFAYGVHPGAQDITDHVHVEHKASPIPEEIAVSGQGSEAEQITRDPSAPAA